MGDKDFTFRQIQVLLRESIDFTLAEKQRMLQELPKKSITAHRKLLKTLQDGAERFADLLERYPERAIRERQQSQQEWDELFS